MPSPNVPTWIDIDLNAIESNARHLSASTGRPLMAIVKCNGYGLGAVEISKAALRGGATWLAVARYSEARQLRDGGIDAPVLLLSMVTSDEIDDAVSSQLTLSLYSLEMVSLYSEHARSLGRTINVHIKVDTGMGRLGIFNHEIPEMVRRIRELGGIHIDGIYSHFAMADVASHPLIRVQIDRFKEAVQILRENGIQPRWIHMANSGGTLYEPDSHFNMVRAGAALYGFSTRDNTPLASGLKPTFSWKARLASCKVVPAGWGISYGQVYNLARDEIIGVVTAGYADGLKRVLGNEILIDGIRTPIVGRLCMDHCMVSLPRMYPLGTEVVLIGTQGNETISVEDLARRWNTAEHDVPTHLNIRVPRIYA